MNTSQLLLMLKAVERLHQYVDERSSKKKKISPMQSFVLKHRFSHINTAFGKTAPLKESFMHEGAQ